MIGRVYICYMDDIRCIWVMLIWFCHHVFDNQLLFGMINFYPLTIYLTNISNRDENSQFVEMFMQVL